LNGDNIAKCISSGTSESEADRLGFAGLDVGKNGQRHRKLEAVLSLDFILDWDIHNFDRQLGEVLFIVECEAATLFPWPESVVEYFNLFDKRRAWAGFKDSFRSLHKFGSADAPLVLFSWLFLTEFSIISKVLH